MDIRRDPRRLRFAHLRRFTLPRWIRARIQVPAVCLSAALVSTVAAAAGPATLGLDARLSQLEALAGRHPAQAELELQALSADSERLDGRARLRIDLIRLLIADSQYRANDVLALSDRIAAAAEADGDARIRALIAHARAGAFYLLGRSEEARGALEQEMAQARSTRDEDPIAQALLDQARFLMKRGDFEQACASITDAERHARGAQIAAEVAFSTALLAKAVGDAPLALQSYRDAYAKFHAVADRTGEADSQAGIGAALHQLGRSGEAIAPLTQAAAAYREVGDPEGEAVATDELALSQADLGRLSEALSLNADAIRVLGRTDSPQNLATLQVDRAQLLLLAKRPGEALPLIERARPFAQQAEDLKLHVHFHHVAAGVLAALGRSASAYEQSERAEEAQRRRTDQLVARQLAAQRGRLESELLTRENALLRNEADAGQRALEQARRASRLQAIAIGLALVLIPGAGFALWRQRLLLKRIKRMAETDPLTGVPNRRRVLELGQRLMQRCHQDGRPYAMLLLDLDGFKRINDRHGHSAGDVALCMVAETMRNCIRPDDHLGRYGGEEFAVLLPGANPAEAAAVAERLRAAVAALEPDWAPGASRLTLSGGIAIATSERTDFSQLLVQADQALYCAKNAGRNRIELAPL